MKIQGNITDWDKVFLLKGKFCHYLAERRYSVHNKKICSLQATRIEFRNEYNSVKDIANRLGVSYRVMQTVIDFIIKERLF